MQMYTIVTFTLVVIAAVSALPQRPNEAQILRYENDNIGVGGYNFVYETSDGTARQESAELKNAGTENEAISVRGQYSYVGDDGVQYIVTYIADENGFQPQGAHLPK